MRKQFFVPVLLAVAVACSEAPTSSPTASQPPGDLGVQAASGVTGSARGSGVTASATGSGIIVEGRHFAFSANTKSSGVTTGNAELTYSGPSPKVHMTLDCLRVAGNTATLSGYIRSVRGLPGFHAGNAIWFSVVDNGEPSTNDMITPVIFWDDSETPMDCTEDVGLQPVPIQAGNIQVH